MSPRFPESREMVTGGLAWPMRAGHVCGATWCCGGEEEGVSGPAFSVGL